MQRLSFSRDADFDTERHRAYREDGWIGGSHTELLYFLSCLTGINYLAVPDHVWNPAAREYVASKVPTAHWIAHSIYFAEFALLLVKDLYRQGELGTRFPIWLERREERATRFAISNPDLRLEEVAKRLKTTVRQLQRNGQFNLARREFQRQHTSPPKS